MVTAPKPQHVPDFNRIVLRDAVAVNATTRAASRTDRARRTCQTEPFDKTSLRDKLDPLPFYIKADVTAMHWSLGFVPGMDAATTSVRPTRGSKTKRPVSPRCRAAKNGDELPPPHSTTSSARASSVGGTSSPSALAVLRLITSSNLVGV